MQYTPSFSLLSSPTLQFKCSQQTIMLHIFCSAKQEVLKNRQNPCRFQDNYLQQGEVIMILLKNTAIKKKKNSLCQVHALLITLPFTKSACMDNRHLQTGFISQSLNYNIENTTEIRYIFTLVAQLNLICLSFVLSQDEYL